MSHEKLIRTINKCSKHNVGDGYLVMVNGRFHRPNTSVEMAQLMARYVGGRIRYRAGGFADGTHWRMAAVITTIHTS